MEGAAESAPDILRCAVDCAGHNVPASQAESAAGTATGIGPDHWDRPALALEERDTHIIARLAVPSSVPELSLLCLSDTHDVHRDMPHDNLPRADILIHAGDFTNIGSREEVESFTAWTDTLLHSGVVDDIVFVAGNHDLSMPLTAKHPAVKAKQEQMKQTLVNRSHVHYLEDSGCTVRGMHFWGSPWTSRFGRDWAFQLLDNDDPEHGLGGKFAMIPAASCDVLVTHQPPLGQGDAPGAAHGKGSRMLLERVMQVTPLLHVFGHIHPGHGITTRDGCRSLFVNAAICDEDVRPTQKPILVVMHHHAGSSEVNT